MKKLTCILFIAYVYTTALYSAALPITDTSTTLQSDQFSLYAHTQNQINKVAQQAPSPINMLPDELLQHTLSFLKSEPIAFVQASRTCRRWHNATNDITNRMVNKLLHMYNQNPKTTLMHAIAFNFAFCLKPLVNKGASINNSYRIIEINNNNEQDQTITTPLKIAIDLTDKFDDVDFSPTIQALLTCNADPNFKSTPHEKNALEHASSLNNEAIVRLLLKHGASTHVGYFDDHCLHESSDTIRLLIDANRPWIIKTSTSLILNRIKCIMSIATPFMILKTDFYPDDKYGPLDLAHRQIYLKLIVLLPHIYTHLKRIPSLWNNYYF